MNLWRDHEKAFLLTLRVDSWNIMLSVNVLKHLKYSGQPFLRNFVLNECVIY